MCAVVDTAPKLSPFCKGRDVAETDAFEHAISRFGEQTKAKLSNRAASGAPEDQLRAPLESLIGDLALVAGLPVGALNLVGESTLAHLKTRPDYAVVVHGALVGFIEVKAPGKGADPRRFADPHDKAQWVKLKSLPNVLYTDGNSFGLWRDGQIVGAVAHLVGDVENSGASLAASPALLGIVTDFLGWHPIPPRTAKQLAEVSARLCRLLREEVAEQLRLGSEGLSGLATDWRAMLFPEASDDEFADGYSQAVTFGLLIARARNISLSRGIDSAAQELRQTNSLIGTALRLLTDDDTTRKALQTSLGTLTRVLEAIDWSVVTKGNPDAWLYFYEDFLAVYDNTLRKRTGSYYTPPEVVAAMVRLVDDILRSPNLFAQSSGFASPDVTVADPAVGTGTFLLGVLRKIAGSVEEDQGAGAVPAAIAAAARRLIGFELQFGPFAVAQLRLLAEIRALMSLAPDSAAQVPDLRLFITDTLGNPFAEEEQLAQILQPIARSRRQANEVKRGEPITVVIGNPPYKEKAKGRGGWIEAGTPGRAAPLDRWTPPPTWGVSAHAKHLKNLYVYFWRWATWKVFGTGLHASTGLEEVDRAGVICFITVAGFLNGPGFEKMRDDLRRSCTEIWVIDCSPEGHQPEVATRIFQGVQQPVCIVVAARKKGKDAAQPAHVHFHALPAGRRDVKFEALAGLSLDGAAWADCPGGWRDPFLPASASAWSGFPTLDDFFDYNGSGVMPGRTWVIAPDVKSLQERWTRLVRERNPVRKEELFHPHEGGDRTLSKKSSKGLSGHEHRATAVGLDSKPAVSPTRYAVRSFDRQWIIPDNRLINRPNPTLWEGHSSRQVYLTAIEDHAPSGGPAVTLSGLIPDLHHYNGRGGRAYPLWGDAENTKPNVRPALLAILNLAYGRPVDAADVMSYLAAVLAHPAFVARFASDLVRPGLRAPLTADPALFEDAVELGKQIVWLHSFGERFADPGQGRPARPPRLPKDLAPRIPAKGAIPSEPEAMPNDMDYDAALRRLRIGQGYIDNVSPEVWSYEVSGKQVLRQWFSYRRRDRSRPLIGDRRPPSPLDRIQPEGWPAEYTTDLLDLLHVLGCVVMLEPKQADLLERICAGKMLDAGALRAGGAFALPNGGGRSRSGMSDSAQSDFLDSI